ncbi:MAG: hypothetical protein QM730_10800 [Anaerolineales bacterium]
MNFNFGEILTRAWQIVWKFKVLWIFGILAGCARGGSGGNGGGSSRFDINNPSVPPGMERFFERIADNVAGYVLGIICLLCVIWIIAIFLGTIGRIGLIRGVAQADGGAEHMIFGQLFSESTPYFWRMFGLSLIIALPVLILVAIALAGAVAVFVPVAVSNGGGNSPAPAIGFLGILSLFGVCMCFLVPFLLVAGLIIRQAENAIVLEDMRVLPSLSRGWEVFRKNLGPIFIMAIILWVISIVAGMIIAIPIVAVAVPSAITFALGQGRQFAPMILLGVCLCIYIPVSMVLNGILTAYTQSAWTLTYRRLTGFTPPAPAPVVVEPPLPPEDSDKTVIARPQ